MPENKKDESRYSVTRRIIELAQKHLGKRGVEFCAQAITLFTSATTSAMVYESGKTTLEQLIKLLGGQFNDPVADNLSVSDFTQDPTHILALIYLIAGTACLFLSNQTLYAHSTKKMWGYLQKEESEAKKNSDDQSKGDENNIGINNTNNKGKNCSTKISGNVKKFLEDCANLLGTHFEVVVSSGSLERMVSSLIGNPYIRIPMIILLVVLAEASQFTIFSNKKNNYGLKIFDNSLLTSIEGIIYGAIGWGMAYAIKPGYEPFAAMFTWVTTSIMNTLSVAYSQETLTNKIISYLLSACCCSTQELKEIVVIENKEKNETKARDSRNSSLSSFKREGNSPDENKPLLMQ